MDIPKEVLVAIIGAIPALAAPLLSSLLQHRGFAQRTKELELLEKRVQVIERLLVLEKHLSDERKKMLQTELADIAQDLVADRVRERAAGGTVVERLPMLRRFLLVYEQPTSRASAYRNFFWFFLSISVLGFFSVLFVGKTIESANWPIAAIGMLFYVMIGLFFRSAALRQQKRAQATAAGTLRSDTGS